MNGSRRIRLLLVLFLVVTSLGGYGGYWWLWIRGTVSTDDAYVDARIVSISSRLPGRIVEVNFEEGDLVSRGDVLAQLGLRKLKAMVRSHEAAVLQADAILQNLIKGASEEEIDVAMAEVRVAQVALAKSRADLGRAEQLAEVNAISAAALDHRRSDVALARAELEVARKRLIDVRSPARVERIAEAEATLERERALLEDAKVDMKDGKMISPIDGIVARRTIDPGEVVQPGQGMFQVVENGRTWIVANLEEQDIAALEEGQPVEITLDAYPGRTFKGRVGPLYGATLSRFSLLSTASASGNFIKVTQRVPVRIDWAEDYAVPMVPGLNAEIRIYLNGAAEEE